MPDTSLTSENVPNSLSLKSADDGTLPRKKYRDLFKLADDASSLLLENDKQCLTESYKLGDSIEELATTLQGLVNVIHELQSSSTFEKDAAAREKRKLLTKLAVSNALREEWERLYEEMHDEKEKLHKELWAYQSQMHSTKNRFRAEIHKLKQQLEEATQGAPEPDRSDAKRRKITATAKGRTKSGFAG